MRERKSQISEANQNTAIYSTQLKSSSALELLRADVISHERDFILN